MTPADARRILYVVVATLALVIISVLAMLLYGLTDPKIDNDKILPIISHAFDTIVGCFIGVVSCLILQKTGSDKDE